MKWSRVKLEEILTASREGPVAITCTTPRNARGLRFALYRLLRNRDRLPIETAICENILTISQSLDPIVEIKNGN